MRILSIFKTFCKNTKCFKYRENICEVLFWIKAFAKKFLIVGFLGRITNTLAIFFGLQILISSGVGLQIRRNGG